MMSVALSICQPPPFRSSKENPIMKIIAYKPYIVQEGQPLQIAIWKLTVVNNDEEGPQER